MLVEQGKIVSIFAVYVDDFVIGSDSEFREIWIIEKLKPKFKIKMSIFPLNWKKK